MKLNEKQKRALDLLEDFIAQEKKKRRIANDLAFITSAATKPDWSQKPEEWADDWCDGWAFDLGTHLARALAITLDKFVEKKKPVLKWVQRTAFDFRIGYVVHSHGRKYENLPWGEQVPNNPVSYLVQDARGATPWQHGVKAKPFVKRKPPENDSPAIPYKAPERRDAGFVVFQTLLRENDYRSSLLRRLSQDDFIRFLIIGEDFFNMEPKRMTDEKLELIIHGDSGNYKIHIATEPKPTLSCSCPGAANGGVCKHMREILRGDFSRIADLSPEKKEILEDMLASKEMNEIVESQAIQIDWLEKEEERIKKEIKDRKKLLAQALGGGQE